VTVDDSVGTEEVLASLLLEALTLFDDVTVIDTVLVDELL
jgi:hypothetical protein